MSDYFDTVGLLLMDRIHGHLSVQSRGMDDILHSEHLSVSAYMNQLIITTIIDGDGSYMVDWLERGSRT